jgi:CysZ protein
VPASGNASTIALPDWPARPGPVDLLRGAWLPAQALHLIARDGRLRALSLLAALVTASTLVVLAWALWPWSQTLAHEAVGREGWRGVAGTTLGLLAFGATFSVAALSLPNLALAPLIDPLSERAEVCVGGPGDGPFSLRRALAGTAVSLGHTVTRLLLQGAGWLLLTPLLLLPGPGSTLFGVASTLWAMVGLTAEHLSTPLARRHAPFREVLRALGRRPLAALGLGASLFVLLWVPVLNTALVPVAVVAGTLCDRALGRAAGR